MNFDIFYRFKFLDDLILLIINTTEFNNFRIARRANFQFDRKKKKMEGGKPSQEESYPRIRFIRITFLPLYRLYQRLTSRLREPKFTWLEVLA